MAGDPYYQNVALALPLNTEHQFTDLSKAKNLVYKYGNTLISTAQHELYDASAYFDGNGDYLEIKQYLPGSSLETFEVWLLVTEYTGASTVDVVVGMPTMDNPANKSYQLEVRPNGTLGLWLSNGAVYTVSTDVIALNTWTHVAVVKNGSNWRLFIAGIQQFSITNSTTLFSDSMVQVGRDNTTTRYFKGYLNDLRLTRGIAKYSGNFTPPGSLLSTLSGLEIQESLAADSFIVSAYALTGEHIISKHNVASGAAFDLEMYCDLSGVNVTVSADQGAVWRPNVSYALNAKVFPSDPMATPYYYLRVSAGTSGATEPTWATTPGGRCDDGAVPDAWELVERLIQPITHGPLIPV